MRRSLALVSSVFCAATAVFPAAVSAQNDVVTARSVSGKFGRVVFPASADIDSTCTSRITDTLEEEQFLPGIPGEFQVVGRVTVSLALDPRQDVEAWSEPKTNLIVLPLAASCDWNLRKLRRVLRHELAHIAMGGLPNYDQLPAWFREGFAEWVAGGLSSEGMARIELEIARRQILDAELPLLEGRWDGVADRLAYDLFASFFLLLETRRKDVLLDGELLSRTADVGVHNALAVLYGRTFRQLEREWHVFLRQRFGSPADPGYRQRADPRAGAAGADSLTLARTQTSI